LLTCLRRLGESLVALLHTRVELFARELERERIRVTRLLLLGVAALFFVALGAVTFTIFIIVLFWDSQRLVAIGFLTVVYLGIGAGIAIFAKGEAQRSAKPFSASVAQLKEDREQFRSR
jgi:uncharacterized membrane protein YqjE